jgi:hypothetical protein
MMLRAAHGGRRPLPSLFGCTEALAGPGSHRTRMRRAAAEWRQRADRRATGTGARGIAARIRAAGAEWRSCDYGCAFELGRASASDTASGDWATWPGRSSRWGHLGPHPSHPTARAHRAARRVVSGRAVHSVVAALRAPLSRGRLAAGRLDMTRTIIYAVIDWRVPWAPDGRPVWARRNCGWARVQTRMWHWAAALGLRRSSCVGTLRPYGAQSSDWK